MTGLLGISSFCFVVHDSEPSSTCVFYWRGWQETAYVKQRKELRRRIEPLNEICKAGFPTSPQSPEFTCKRIVVGNGSTASVRWRLYTAVYIVKRCKKHTKVQELVSSAFISEETDKRQCLEREVKEGLKPPRPPPPVLWWDGSVHTSAARLPPRRFQVRFGARTFPKSPNTKLWNWKVMENAWKCMKMNQL